jgi:tRNA pseudouridine38-40 synthase
LNNYKLHIQYIGTNYSGWQIQTNASKVGASIKTIQQEITTSIKIITGENVNLIGAGRTDAGVHALGQIANFRTELKLDAYKFLYSINSLLPKDISITKIQQVDNEFHSRFDAKKRCYLYLLIKYKSPFYYPYTWFYNGDLNCSHLNKISKPLLGKHDFSSFTKKGDEIENKQCTIHDIHWKENNGLVFFFIEADRFLHGMVRAVVGTILSVYKTKNDSEYLKELLSKQDRTEAAMSAPADGLFLYKVKY